MSRHDFGAPMIPCPSEDELGAYLASSLDPEPRRAVEVHLDRCEACYAAVVAYGKAYGAQDVGADPAAPDAAAEPRFMGRYRVDGQLGEGAMGVVHDAYDPRLARHVALKVLRPRPETNPQGDDRRLIAEARALAQLSHPHVVPIFDAGEVDGQVYIAMERIVGPTLRTWSRTRRPWRDALRLLLEAGAGLHAAHEAGLIHRDFKPDNVMVDEAGRARVLDFGLVRSEVGGQGIALDSEGRALQLPEGVERDPSTLAGRWVGTPRYMGPEHFGPPGRDADDPRPSDARSDQFSFCVTAFEVLYGSAPFAGSSLLSLVTAMQAERVVAPPAGSRVPRRVRRVLVRGLRADPDLRWDTMAELIGALQQAGGRRRWPWVIGAAGLICAAGAGVLHASTLAETSAAAPGLEDGSGTSPPTVAAEAQSPEALSVRRRLEQLETLDNERRYEEAAKLSPQTLKDAESLAVPRLIAQAAVLHGRVLLNTDPHKAAAVLQQAYAAAVEADDAELEQRAAFYLARLYAQKIVDPQAAALWLRHAESAVDRLGDVPELRFAVLGLRMIVLRLEGDREAAIAVSRELVVLADSQWGSKDRRAIQARHALGIALMDVQQTTGARAETLRALESARGLDPDLEARCLSLLSSIEVLQNSKHNDPEVANLAVAYAREALDIQTRQHGAAHASTIGARRTVGNALAEAGDLEQAKAEHIAVLEGFTALLGPESAEVGRSAAAVGTVLLDLGELEAAETHLQRSVVSLEAAYGRDHHALATPLGYLGIAQRRRHAFERAHRTYERYIVVAQGSPRQQAVASEGRARVEVESGNHGAAAVLLEAAAQAWVDFSGNPNDPNAQEIRQMIRE